MRARPALLALAAVACLAAPAAASAATAEIVARDLKSPTVVTFRAGSQWPIVAEQKGRIVVVRNGKAMPMADLADRVGQQGGERGLLGLAFHPRFAEDRRVFVNYTDADGSTRISQFAVSKRNRILKATEKVLLRVRQPYANHNGGALAFGPDGLLYIGLGDGGSGGDPGNRAQNPQTPLGKILRIDVNQGDPYGVPPTNPFANGADGLPAIWAIGLRNPWRFSFDRATGALWIGDVGQAQREEVSRIPRKAPALPNLGWNAWEGDRPYAPQPTRGTLVKPIATYAHDRGDCSVTGGYVYRGKAIRALRGRYVFGDWCSGRIWSITARQTRPVETGALLARLSSFGEDAQGELWMTSTNGTLARLRP